MDWGFLIGAWVGFSLGLQIKATVDRIREARASRVEAAGAAPITSASTVLVMICGNRTLGITRPGVAADREPFVCTLPAKHDGWHHDQRTGTEWTEAAS
jgi:hypothetical protein